MIRIQTAPARPVTELEEFKRFLLIWGTRSPEFLLLEQAFICQSRLVQKDFHKYDLDSNEGQRACKKYLNLIEKLCEVLVFSWLSDLLSVGYFSLLQKWFLQSL